MPHFGAHKICLFFFLVLFVTREFNHPPDADLILHNGLVLGFTNYGSNGNHDDCRDHIIQCGTGPLALPAGAAKEEAEGRPE